MKKLPDRITLNRLYWIEELTMKQIGAIYGVSRMSVQKALVRYGIPRRKVGMRLQPHCVENGCEEMVCEIKRYCKGQVVWYPTNRCAKHEHLRRRKYSREYGRSHQRYKGLYRYTRPDDSKNARRQPLGMIEAIKNDR